MLKANNTRWRVANARRHTLRISLGCCMNICVRLSLAMFVQNILTRKAQTWKTHGTLSLFLSFFHLSLSLHSIFDSQPLFRCTWNVPCHVMIIDDTGNNFVAKFCKLLVSCSFQCRIYVCLSATCRVLFPSIFLFCRSALLRDLNKQNVMHQICHSVSMQWPNTHKSDYKMEVNEKSRQ